MLIRDAITDFLFAPKSTCMGCGCLLGADKGPVCADCYSKLKPLYPTERARSVRCVHCGGRLDKRTCATCRKRDGNGLMAFHAYEYEEPIRTIIHNFKYRSVFTLDDWMASECVKALSKYKDEFDVIVPVPMHFLRKLERGYNQSERIAEKISSFTGIPFEDALKRIRYTSKQSNANKEERLKRLSGAFKAKNDMTGKRVLLIDDVVTTGSTMIECVHALMKAGASKVALCTFAVTVQEQK